MTAEAQAGVVLDRLMVPIVGRTLDPFGLLLDDDGGPWSPSNNMAHAWEVVEALRARGIELGLLPGDPEWICGFSVAGSPIAWHESLLYRDEPDACGKWARAETAPLAICRAALLAIEQGAAR